MSVADDYGRFFGSAATVRGACWPTCPEKVSERDVAKWLTECAQGERPLIRFYEVSGCRFLEITDFGQQVRSKSKYPAYDSSLQSTCAHDAEQLRSTSRSRISESESKAESGKKDTAVAVSKESDATPHTATFGPRELLALWNQTADQLGLSKVQDFSDSRREKTKHRLHEHPDREFWDSVFDMLARSPFALGHGKDGWKMNFDKLVLNDTVAAKILEGDYVHVRGSASLDFTGGSAPPGKITSGQGVDWDREKRLADERKAKRLGPRSA